MRLWTARERFHLRTISQSWNVIPLQSRVSRFARHSIPRRALSPERFAARPRRIFAASRADSPMLPDFLLGPPPRKSEADVEHCSGSCRDQQGRQICLRRELSVKRFLGLNSR